MVRLTRLAYQPLVLMEIRRSSTKTTDSIEIGCRVKRNSDFGDSVLRSARTRIGSVYCMRPYRDVTQFCAANWQVIKLFLTRHLRGWRCRWGTDEETRVARKSSDWRGKQTSSRNKYPISSSVHDSGINWPRKAHLIRLLGRSESVELMIIQLSSLTKLEHYFRVVTFEQPTSARRSS